MSVQPRGVVRVCATGAAVALSLAVAGVAMPRVAAAGAASAAGTLREDITVKNHTCTSNSQFWTATQ
jgi:hypothetical protein